MPDYPGTNVSMHLIEGCILFHLGNTVFFGVDRAVETVAWLKTLPQFKEVPWDQPSDSPITMGGKIVGLRDLKDQVEFILAGILSRDVNEQFANTGMMSGHAKDLYISFSHDEDFANAYPSRPPDMSKFPDPGSRPLLTLTFLDS